MRDAGQQSVDRPIFVVGMPRSGTTVLFELLASHGDLGWFSQHLERMPRFPIVTTAVRAADLGLGVRRSITRSDQGASLFDRALRVGPSEAYSVWERCCGPKIRFEYLLGAGATAKERTCVSTTVRKVLRYEGKRRFAAKMTGPGRLSYLSSIFPDAHFVHVVRDGRAVVHSLMRVPFWKERRRMTEPAWANGLLPIDVADWERHARSPISLAAVQWRRVLETTRSEAAELGVQARYREFRYESFAATPSATLEAIMSFCGLPPSVRAARFLRERFVVKDMNYRWRRDVAPGDIETLNEILGPALMTFGYDI